MATPTDVMSAASNLAGNTGPPQGILQKLLEEIRVSESETGPDRSFTVSAPSSRRGSVWLPTSTMALDATERLRAVELGRHMTRSIYDSSGRGTIKDDSSSLPVRRCTVSVKWPSVASGKNVVVPSPPGELVKNSSAAPDEDSTAIPTLSPPSPESPKRSAGVIACPERPRNDTPRQNKNGNDDSSFNSYAAFGSGYAMGRRDRSSTARPPTGTPTVSALPASLRRGSSIEPVSEATISRLTGAPVTRGPHSGKGSVVNLMPTSTSSRPLKRIDSGRSREDYGSHRLCMDCFQQRGNFCRILSDSCEVCDGIEPLESHYWEGTDSE